MEAAKSMGKVFGTLCALIVHCLLVFALIALYHAIQKEEKTCAPPQWNDSRPRADDAPPLYPESGPSVR